LNVLLDGFSRLAFCVAVGGLVWYWVLRSIEYHGTHDLVLTPHALALTAWSAFALAGSQGLLLIVKAWTLAQTLDGPVFTSFIHTTQFQARLAQAIVSCGLGVAARRFGRAPLETRAWGLTAMLAIGVIGSGAWLTHAAGRYDARAWLMTLTSLHQVGAACWVGGVIGLAWTWRVMRRYPALSGLWAPLVRRFSFVGGAAVTMLLLSGLGLARDFIGSWAGLVGTAYGVLLIGKLVLIGGALGLAALNFLAGRRQADGRLATAVPYYIEAESMLLLVILLTATSLSSQAPSRDIVQERASWTEVVNAIRLHAPTLASPSLAEVNAEDAARSIVSGGDTPANIAWSEYNHNVAGLFVTSLGVLGLMALRWPGSLARHWPLGFVPLAFFLGARSDPDTWPLGTVGFWEGTFGSMETLQHRLAVLVALALGLMEWRSRLRTSGNSRWAWAFPGLALFGGMLLLTHSHATFERKEEFLIQLSHNVIGVLAVFLGCCRLLELRLRNRGVLAGATAMVCMIGIGLMLLGYREPAVPHTTVERIPVEHPPTHPSPPPGVISPS